MRLCSAPEFAERLLAPLGDRWLHVRTAGRRAEKIKIAVPAADRDLFVAAVWLHDIGYAPAAVSTGFHPLDGAQFLAGLVAPQRLCSLVAHHSGAFLKARELGLSVELARWERETGPLPDALAYTDMTTGPQGQVITLDERLREIHSRHGADSVSARVFPELAPVLRASILAVQDRLEQALRTDRSRLADLA